MTPLGLYEAVKGLVKMETLVALMMAVASVQGQISDTPAASVRLSTLVLAAYEQQAAIARVYLEGVGTHFDVSASAAATKFEENGRGLYSAIIVAGDRDPSVIDYLPALRAYAKKYNVRIVFLNTKSSATITGSGCTAVENAGEGGWENPPNGDEANVHMGMDAKAVAKDPAISDAVNDYGYWKIYDFTSMKPKPFQCDENAVQVFMRFGGKGLTSAPSNGPIAAFVSKTSYGTEEMYFGWDATFNYICPRTICKLNQQDKLQNADGEDTITNLALANLWFGWATKGIFLGQRKANFQLHIDDWYAKTAIFPDFQLKVRTSGKSLQYVLNWQRNLNQAHQLPEGSDFRFELAYNGAGFLSYADYETDEDIANGDSLTLVSMQNAKEFNWVSHTWTHQHLDYAAFDDCKTPNTVCPLPAARMEAELKYNADLGMGNNIRINKAVFPNEYFLDTNSANFLARYGKNGVKGYRLPTNRFSKNSLVPPEISGLVPRGWQFDASKYWPENKFASFPPRPDNSLLHQTFKKMGILHVTGDNSRPELYGDKVSPHHPYVTKAENYTVPGLVILPRHSLSIAYNVHNEDRFLQFYNQPGASQCWGTFGPPCANKIYTLDEAIDRQAFNAMYYLLAFRHDPYMFHQANLHAFTKKDTQDTITLVTYFADATLYRYMNMVSKIPIRSPKMDNIGTHYLERLSRDTCGIEADANLKDGQMSSVSIKGNDMCKPVLTIRRSTKLQLAGFNPELYGIDAIHTVEVNNNTVTIELTSSSDSYTPQIVAQPPKVFTWKMESGVEGGSNPIKGESTPTVPGTGGDGGITAPQRNAAESVVVGMRCVVAAVVAAIYTVLA